MAKISIEQIILITSVIIILFIMLRGGKKQDYTFSGNMPGDIGPIKPQEGVAMVGGAFVRQNFENAPKTSADYANEDVENFEQIKGVSENVNKKLQDLEDSQKIRASSQMTPFDIDCADPSSFSNRNMLSAPIVTTAKERTLLGADPIRGDVFIRRSSTPIISRTQYSDDSLRCGYFGPSIRNIPSKVVNEEIIMDA